MSNEPIRVGDLVMVVKPAPCCGATKAIGVTGTVTGNEPAPYGECTSCCAATDTTMAVKLDNGKPYLLSRLRRIPPLVEPVTQQDEAHA